MPKFSKTIITLIIFTLLSPATSSATNKGDEVIRALVGEIISEVETFRELKFIQVIDTELITNDELKNYLFNELNTQVPPEKERAIELVYGQLGLIPTEQGFLETYSAMYEQQAGGIYDWRGGRLLIVPSNLPGISDEGEIGSGMLSLLGVDPNMLVKTVLAHELTHALEDQHFQFNERFKEIQKLSSSDREFALQALVEGSATRLMMEHATGGIPLSPLQRSLNRILTNLLTDLSINLPLYYKRSMTAPYTLGEAFVSSLMDNNNGGWSAINAAYTDIPTSMEQVIHPDKYYGQRDYPSDVQLADFTEIIGEGSKELLQDTLGEMVIGILLDIQLKWDEFEDAPRGWDGDRLVGIQGPDGEVTIVWHSVWDSDSDAFEFTEALQKFVRAKLPDRTIVTIGCGPGVSGYLFVPPDSRAYYIYQTGDEVIYIDNAYSGIISDLKNAARDNDVIIKK